MNSQLIQSRSGLGTANPLFVGSIPTRASISFQGNGMSRTHENRKKVSDNNCLIIHTKEVVISDFVIVPVSICINKDSNKLAVKFNYKQSSHTIFLNCSLSELTEEDIDSIVKSKIRELDNVLTLICLLDFILSCDECGGNEKTRKKNVAHFKDFCKRENISLDESSVLLMRIDEQGRTLPERWEEIYGLPHKLRQVRSLFSKKNLVLFCRKGWDTKHFGNFVSFVPESTVSQPFTTTDDEVERIIKFFQDNRESNPVFYDIYLLAFGCGLRKAEIYQVQKKDFTTYKLS